MPPDPPPHVILRTATAAAHERLHHLPDFADLAAGRLTRASYAALLARLFGFNAPVEAAIVAALGGGAFGLDVPALCRAPLLRADLRGLGRDEAAIDRLPQTAPPRYASAAAAVGALYVLEGATLGGRQLARGLDALLGAGVPDGRRFLAAAEDPARPRWRDIRAALDRCGTDPGRLADMVDSARRTFDLFGAWFAPPQAPNHPAAALHPGAAAHSATAAG